MQTENPDFRRKVQEIFDRAAFIKDVGVSVSGIGVGWCETTLAVMPKHLQQNDYVHAGVLATMADHTAGGAAASVIKEAQIVLSVEFKINLLRPAIGEFLRCKANLLKAGRTLVVAESEVFARAGVQEKLVAKATVTLAVVNR